MSRAFTGGRPKQPDVRCKNHPGKLAFVKSRRLCRNCFNAEPDQQAKRADYRKMVMTDEEWTRARVNEGANRDKQRVFVALDPGISTGMAVIDSEGELRASTTWGTEELSTSLDALIRGLHISGYSVEVVIQALPPGSYGSLGLKLAEVRRRIDYIVRETYELPVTMVTSKELRGSAAAVKGWRFGGAPMTPEQRSAFRMGSYAHKRRKETMEKLRLEGWAKGRRAYERG